MKTTFRLTLALLLSLVLCFCVIPSAFAEGEGDSLDNNAEDYVTITFNKNNGNATGDMLPQLVELAKKTIIRANEFTYDNYTFDSWNVRPDGSGTSYADQGDIIVNDSIILYAQWIKTSYAVNYDKNGGGGTQMTPDSIPKNEKGTVKENAYNAPNTSKVFGEWNTNKNGSGTIYRPGDDIMSDDVPTDITLYAQWKDKLEIWFNPGAATGDAKTIEEPKGSEVKFPTYTDLGFKPLSGQSFAGWKVSGDNAIYKAGDPYVFTSASQTVTAQWADTIHLTYNANGGTLTTSAGTKDTYVSTIPQATDIELVESNKLHLKRDDYEFKGWAMSSGAKEPKDGWEAENEPITVTGGFTTETEIFAVWEKHAFSGVVTISGSYSGYTGEAYVGETLMANITGEKVFTEFAYQWRRDGEDIPGATSDTYDVTAADFGKDISCAVTALEASEGRTKTSNIKTVVIEEEEKRIVNNGETEIDYIYGLLDTMYYTVNNGVRQKVTLDSAGRFAVTSGGTYRFYENETSNVILARVEVVNWFTIGYAYEGSGTVKLNLGSSTITSSTKFTGKMADLIEYYPKMSGYVCWIVREGANIGTFTLTVQPASGNYAHVYLNEELIDSFGTSSYSSSSSSSSSGTWPRTYTVNTPLEHDKQLTTSPGKVFRIVFNRTPPTSDIIAEIDETTFPDPIFRDIILGRYDHDRDGKLSKSEIYAVKTLSCSMESINSLKGVEYFTELTTLYCSDNNLIELDLSACKSLTNLNCQGNYLTQLDLSNCPELRKLICSGNTLKALDVSFCPALASLDCSSNVLAQLTLQNNAALTTLNCSNNNLTNLDLTGNSALNSLICYGNALRQVTLAENAALVVLNSSGNLLSSLDLGDYSALRNLRCSGNLLTELDLSGAPALNNLECQGNRLNSIGVANCDALSTVNCANNLLEKLNVSGCTVLKTLHCEQNQLTNLALTSCSSLKTLCCYDNNLSKLDLLDSPILVELVESREPVTTGTWVTYGEMNEMYGSPVLRCDNNVKLNIRSSIVDLTPDLILPTSLTTIDAEAFTGGAFTYVILPDGAEAIGRRAFADCPKLAYICIPASVTSIDENAFDGVTGLTIVGVPGSEAENFAHLHGFAFKAQQ